MRLLIFLLISFPAYAEYEFEKSKYQENTTCEGMIVTWYTDVNIAAETDGNVRHITKLVRNADGSAQLTGLSIYLDLAEVNPWQFSSAWSCDGEWYTEMNEWGYTSFKIVVLGSENILSDELGNLSANNIMITETPNIDFNNQVIAQYFDSK